MKINGVKHSNFQHHIMRASSLMVLALSLVACPDVGKDWKLSTIIPSVVTPGDAVTAFGDFPDGITVKVAGIGISNVIQSSSSLSFTVPSNVVAGDVAVILEKAGVKLEGSLGVNPRLDAISLNSGVVQVSGSGWSNPLDASVQALLDGYILVPRVVASGLAFDLPSTVSYGSFAVGIRVGERYSNTLRVARQAGTVTGTVILPAQPNSSSPDFLRLQTNPRLQARDTSTLTTFTVFHDSPLLELQESGLVSTLKLPAFNATQFKFDSAKNAQIALTGFSSLPNVRVEWASTITPSVSALAASVPAPSSAGVGQWHLALEGVSPAWKTSQGEGVTVAVIDTGVDLEHPDLKANLLPGYDFVDLDAAPQDIAGHGTHVAGLVAANGLALGVAPHAKILPVRVLKDLSGGSDGTVALGILWAAGLMTDPANPHPAQIINLSLGSPDFSSLIADAVSRAQAVGVIVVAAAGNRGESALAFPAALPGVVSVTALAGPTGAYQPYYAQKGNGLWITAYGGDLGADQDHNGVQDGILSTYITMNGSGYALDAGTSMACPQASGMLALALSSGTKPDLARDMLAANATDMGVKGYDPQFGFGLVSGRSGSPSNPRAYVIALESGTETMISYSLVQPDGTFTLSNLPPGKSLELRAVSDQNANGKLAEAGELISEARVFTAQDAQTLNLEPFNLNPSDGLNVFQLALHP
jgi:serine protease